MKSLPGPQPFLDRTKAKKTAQLQTQVISHKGKGDQGRKQSWEPHSVPGSRAEPSLRNGQNEPDWISELL